MNKRKNNRKQMTNRWLLGILLVLFCSVFATAGPVYADVAPGSSQTGSSEDISVTDDTDIQSNDPSAEQSHQEDASGSQGGIDRNTVILIVLGAAVVLACGGLAARRIFLRPVQPENMEGLFEEHSLLYEKMHRYYAFCTEELLRAERLGVQDSSGRLAAIRQDVIWIYDERSEANTNAETIRSSQKNSKAAVRSMRNLISKEEEYLRRLERYYKELKEMNAKYL